MNSSTEFNYEQMWKEEKPFADRLAVWIKQNLNPRQVIDLGCGPGMYVTALRELNVVAYGFDINPIVEGREGLVLMSLFDVDDPSQVVLCIEVAEHIKESAAKDLVAAVARNTMYGGTLIWSAAHPGQGGIGHINCQPKEYWESLLAGVGMRRDFRREQHLLGWIRDGYHMGWFSMNAMVFVRGLI